MFFQETCDTKSSVEHEDNMVYSYKVGVKIECNKIKQLITVATHGQLTSGPQKGNLTIRYFHLRGNTFCVCLSCKALEPQINRKTRQKR